MFDCLNCNFKKTIKRNLVVKKKKSIQKLYLFLCLDKFSKFQNCLKLANCFYFIFMIRQFERRDLNPSWLGQKYKEVSNLQIVKNQAFEKGIKLILKDVSQFFFFFLLIYFVKGETKSKFKHKTRSKKRLPYI